MGWPVEHDTIDRWQGRDKPCVLLSLVRSGGGDVGEILRDARRLNVACSRAKHKIVLIGSAETLTRGSPALARVVALADAQRTNAFTKH